MKHFLVQRVCPLVVALSLVISMVIPAYAAFDEGMKDYDSVDEWDRMISHPGEAVLNILGEAFGVEVSAKPVFWAAVDRFVIPYADRVDRVTLENIAARCNETFDRPYGYNFFEQFIRGSEQVIADVFSLGFLGTADLNFTVEKHPASGYYRIYENTLGLWLVSSIGTYPYYDPSVGDHWIETTSAYALMGKAKLAVVDGSVLESTAKFLTSTGDRAYVADFGTKYKAIYQDGHKILANSDGLPYVALSSDPEWAVNQDRNDTTVKENGEVIEGVTDNSTHIDLSGMTVTLPDGSINFIDQLIYDESTKSYHIDSHDTYNYETNYYYEWNYYINYTSITYIGQTEEYNKYYEVYYELPDGRDSADLTAEELEQLNVSIDVIPYGRSADDTSLRSLYHFDGDTHDSSYWNYCTDFTWNKGASLTYMDAGVFEGALYLDETEHDFTLTLPSSLSSTDGFTLQFRYYQSYTAAPQTDSYITIGTVTPLKMNGGYFLNGSGTKLAATPIGSWNEVAIILDDGTLYFYLNGVCIGKRTFSGLLSNQIQFHFGADQQTYKYLDELRVLNYPLATGGAYYECTSVPYDTNLALVLPDSAAPVADEYYEMTFTDGALHALNLTGNGSVDDFVLSSSRDCTFLPGVDGALLSAVGTSSQFNAAVTGTGWVSSCSRYAYLSYAPSDSGVYFLSVRVLASDNQVYDLLTVLHYDATEHIITLYDPLNGNANIDVAAKNVAFPGGVFGVDRTWPRILFSTDPSYDYCLIKGVEVYLSPSYGSALGACCSDAVAFQSAFDFEKVSFIAGIDTDSMNTPTLAVRTDLDITSYQIGGVRPSLPTKGQVWALVESARITSIQIYNGSAWEGVDGRIWTGSRWIPASSYNIITLQDMYDIKDATQDFEYIYTENGFWTWWQKSWNSFTEKFFNSFGSGSSGGSSAPSTVKETVSQALSSLIEGIFGVITEVLKSLIGTAADLISGVFGFFSDMVIGGVKDFFSSLGELVNPFQSTVENEDGTTTTITGLPDGVGTVFAFVSGLFMVMPAELHTVMLFGIGLMLLLAVFKKVGA